MHQLESGINERLQPRAAQDSQPRVILRDLEDIRGGAQLFVISRPNPRGWREIRLCMGARSLAARHEPGRQ
jgi:hypothetical protein